MTKFLNISTDNTLGGSSATNDVVSSQKAIKEYVDSQTGAAPSFSNITGQPTDNANLATALNLKANSADLSSVATSGSYSDLTGTPTVDQTYGSSSTNAQSGVAVAGAISTKANTSLDNITSSGEGVVKGIFDAKIVLVNSLPATPDSGVWYGIPE